MIGKTRTLRPAWMLAAILTLFCTLAVRSSCFGAGQEKKIIIYIVYHKSSSVQKMYVDYLFKNFNKLGFSDRMKKKGVSWVEAGFGASGSATSFLHIGADDIIYFGVLMADGQEHITREMFRARVRVGSTKPKKIKVQAENDAHRLYFGASDVLDLFQSKSRWARQVALVNARSQPAEQVHIVVDGKDVTGSFPKPPFHRANIHVAMVPITAPFFKRLGAESVGSEGKGAVQWIKKGPRTMRFDVGDSVVDTRIFVVSYQGGTYKHFVSPVMPMFAYPELQGETMFVPLSLAVKELGLPYDVKTEGNTVTLTRKSASGKAIAPKPSPAPNERKDGDKKGDKKDDKKADKKGE